MRTKVTITGTPAPAMRTLLSALFGSDWQAEPDSSETYWLFPTVEQAADAVLQLKELQRAIVDLRPIVIPWPGCLDGEEARDA